MPPESLFKQKEEFPIPVLQHLEEMYVGQFRRVLMELTVQTAKKRQPDSPTFYVETQDVDAAALELFSDSAKVAAALPWMQTPGA